MDKPNLNPNNSFSRQDKYTNFDRQIKAVRDYLETYTATATMAAVDLDIYRPSVCRYKRILELNGYLKVTHNGVCKVTGHLADYLTCNMDLIKKLGPNNQSLEIEFPDPLL